MKMPMILKNIVMTVIGLTAPIVLAAPLPDLGRVASETFTQKQEKEYGIQFMDAVRTSVELVHDPVVVEYIKNLGFKLASHSQRPADRYHFFVVADSDINAFSGPDGYIGFNSGLIIRVKSEGELAAVMAHEIAHVSQHHLEQLVGKQKSLQTSTIGTLLASIALGAINPIAGVGLASASVAGGYQSLLTFTRAHEAEADHVGMQILIASGYDPRAMPAFFERMAQESRLNDLAEMPTFLQTHPVTEARLADAYNRAEKYPKVAVKESSMLDFIQTRLAVDLSQDAFILEQQYEKQLASHPPVESHLNSYYGYVLALAKVGEFQKALEMLLPLLPDDPTHFLFLFTKADLEEELKKTQEASQDYRTLYKLNPHSYALRIKYSLFLFRQHRYEEALALLTGGPKFYLDDESSMSLLAEVYARTGNLAMAYNTRADLFIMEGNKIVAKSQLKQALQYVKDDLALKREINKKLKELNEL